ncbi:hypothetical protein RJ639_021887 [Escallonia herrerae]|uniref:Protein kinase domain-containing protein n=1 Tax=Escallonia herrerae TaxID=1293975 RepID=A0AA88V4K9_9ASTE|nr:hypothetical protein RJ639_021887 [Escallonia herrerae]
MIGGQTRSSPESGKELIVGSSPIPFTYKDLQLFTDDFSEENLICAAHFGKVYRGKIPQGWDAGEGQHVTVKIWEDIVKTDPLRFVAVPSDCATRFRDELDFLLRPDVDSHPNLVRLKGYCCEDNHLCSVYDLKSSDTLHNFVAKEWLSSGWIRPGDEWKLPLRPPMVFMTGTLKWLDVIKIALGVARALDFLHSHTPPYLIRDLSSAYVMLDEDFNPVLFEFAMLTGGATGDKPPWLVWYFLGSHGYCDWWFTVTGFDAHDDTNISILARLCVDEKEPRRPSMKEVVKQLQRMHVVRRYGESMNDTPSKLHNPHAHIPLVLHVHTPILLDDLLVITIGIQSSNDSWCCEEIEQNMRYGNKNMQQLDEHVSLREA